VVSGGRVVRGLGSTHVLVDANAGAHSVQITVSPKS